MKYALTKQEKDYYCAVSILQAVLRAEREELSQDEIAQALNCTENGISNEQIKRFLGKRGYSFKFTRWNEIANDARDIWLKMALEDNHVFFSIPHLRGYHSFLISNFSFPFMTAINPATGLEEKINYYDISDKEKEVRSQFAFSLIKRL